jgi:hypothetical protein
MQQIDTWRQQCSQNHHDCPDTPLSAPLPTRCIDVSDVDVVRLVNTEDQKGHYICLSHRWGYDNMPIQLTTATMTQLQNGIARDRLPATFQHAVAVTKRMKCRYLWIDTLCIIQAGDDKRDWEVEAAKMASVYRNALLTVSAAAALGASDGLYQTAAPNYVGGAAPLNLSRYDLPFPVFVRHHMRYAVGHLASGQEHWILDRGWVLQERLLSPRVVHFGNNEVAWECMTCRACECEPELRPYEVARYSPREPVNPKAAFIQSIRSGESVARSPALWHQIINAYTGLELTVAEDKFPALAGLALEVSQIRQSDRYLAGLWRSTLMADLLWRKRRIGDWQSTAFTDHLDKNNVFGGGLEPGQARFERKVRHRSFDEQLRDRLLGEVAPSWSWASVWSQIEYEKDTSLPSFGLRNAEFAQLVRFDCNHRHLTGALTTPRSTSVTIRGKLTKVQLQMKFVDYRPHYILCQQDNRLWFDESDYDYSMWPSPMMEGAELYCFRIAQGLMKHKPHMGKVYGLVLELVGMSGEQVYRRVGMFNVAYEHGKEWAVFDTESPSQNVVII